MDLKTQLYRGIFHQFPITIISADDQLLLTGKSPELTNAIAYLLKEIRRRDRIECIDDD